MKYLKYPSVSKLHLKYFPRWDAIRTQHKDPSFYNLYSIKNLLSSKWIKLEGSPLFLLECFVPCLFLGLTCHFFLNHFCSSFKEIIPEKSGFQRCFIRVWLAVHTLSITKRFFEIMASESYGVRFCMFFLLVPFDATVKEHLLHLIRLKQASNMIWRQKIQRSNS